VSVRGFIYYIVCTETFRCKIGFTAGDVAKRLRALQTGSPTDLVILAVHPGTAEDERQLHEKFRACRRRGEWFEPSEALLEHVSLVTWLTAKDALLSGREVDEWVRVGLRVMHEEIGPLPTDLAGLVEA
jgi:hypothetical protein